MGYTTEFEGSIKIEPPLNAEEINYLTKFNEVRHMKRTKGPYFVDGAGYFGQDKEADVQDYNKPDPSQPGLWCQWRPSLDGSSIEWDGNEKFYNAFEWMIYLIEHFLKPDALAKSQFPFLQGHMCTGMVTAQGEEPTDKWEIHVNKNKAIAL